ncbi:MAG TPA: methyltransferase [Candidatus Xenobia bacterium]|jgi:SAM-dependent methyltransferase
MRPPPQTSARDLALALDAVGYTEGAVRSLLGLPHPWNYLPAWRPLLLARLEESPGPLADALAALFLDEPVADPHGDWVIPARTAGLLEGGFIVWPYRGLLLISDPPGPRGMKLQGPRLPMRDRVFPVDASTDLLLQSLVPIQPNTRTLDLGCGTGVLSLLHEGTVGTDINPRCLAFADFNRQLNGRPPVDWRQGDLLGPAHGERFDRVLSNLPFVPTPDDGEDGHAWYWDGGHRGQALAARLLQGLPDVLTPGGMAQFTCGLVNSSTEDALSVLAGWLGDPSMSLLALYGTPQDMARSIPLLATSEADPHEADYPAVVRRWWSAARTADIHEVAPAVVTVVHDGGGMRAAFPMAPGRQDFGPAIERMLKGWRHLQRPAEWEAWRTVRLVPVPGLHLVQEQIWEGEDWGDTPCRVGFTDRPWRLQQTLGRDSVRVLRRCDGLRPLEDVVFAFCMESGRDPSTVRARLLEALPTWISSGLLEVVE